MNPHSPLQASAIDPGLSDRQKKSIVLIVSMKFSTRAGRAGWFRVDFVGASSLCLSRAKQSWISQPLLRLLWNHIWFHYGIDAVGGR